MAIRGKFFGQFFSKLGQKPSTACGAILLFLLILVALFAPYLASYHPENDFFVHKLDPSKEHWLGTDFAGRDVFSRLLYSLRLAYYCGFFAILITAVLGTTIGLLSGFYGGWLDRLVMRFVDLWLALPGLLFVLVMIALLGHGLWQVVLAIGLAGVPGYARFVRGLTINEKAALYVEAARALGASPSRIVFRHILRNIWLPMATLLASRFGGAILVAGSLSFIGVGIQPPTSDLGGLLAEGRDRMHFAWWSVLGPVLVLWLTMLAANLISDGLTERR